MQGRTRRALRMTRSQIAAALFRAAGFGTAGHVNAAIEHHQMHAAMF